MHAHYHLFIIWLHQHPHWGGIAAFVIAFAESVAIIGSIVPGSVTMTAVGVLIGSGVLPVWTTLIWAIAGAFAGDGLSYLLGFYFKDNMRHFWPFSRYPRIISSGETFFLRHGGKSIFIGRFVGPVRAIVPVIAGMLNMRPRRYFPVSFFSAVCWAPMYMLPGILLGAISLELPADIAAELIVFILFLLLAVWLVFWLIKIIYQKTHNYFNALLDHKWRQWMRQPSKYWLCNLLRRGDRPHSHGQLLLASVMLVFAALFCLVLLDSLWQGPLTRWETGVYYLFRSLRTPGLDKIALTIMSFGHHKMLAVVVAALVCWLALRRRWLAVIHWLMAWAWVFSSVFLIGILYVSARPPGLVNLPVDPSFPSKGITSAIVFYALFAFMFTRNMHREARKYIYWLAAIICIAMLFARLYLGLNWLTDLILGICLSGVIVTFVIISYRRYRFVKISAIGVLFVVVAAFAISNTWYLYNNFDKHVRNYQRYWSMHTVSQDAWWNQTAVIPIYRTNRFGRPVQFLNLQWAGTVSEVKATLKLHGWQEPHARHYADIILQLLQRTDFAKRRALIPRLYDDRPPVVEMIKYFAGTHPPLVIRLWQTDILLKPDNTPLLVGAIGYRVVTQHFRVFHKAKLLPVSYKSPDILQLLSHHIWCTMTVVLSEIPRSLRSHLIYSRILLIGKCYR